MKRLLVAGAAAVLLPAGAVNADVLGGGVALSYWYTSVSGVARNTLGQTSVDLDNELDLDSDSSLMASASFEHFMPFLPNVKVGYARVEQTGDSTLVAPFGQISSGSQVQSQLELTQYDLTLYYEILDNWVNLDLGITARSVDAELVVQALTGSITQTDIDTVLPLGYAAARFDLPLTGLSAGAAGNAIAFDGDSLYDLNVYLQYDVAVMRFQGGYRQIGVDYEDDGELIDVRIGGPFISVGVDF